MSEVLVVCRHTRGGFHVWPLERLLKMNLERALRGAQTDEQWHPLALAGGMAAALELQRKLKREVREFRERAAGLAPYGEAEKAADEREGD